MRNIPIKLFFLTTIATMLLSCSRETDNESSASKATIPINASEIQIGNQIWKTKNLDVSRYRNGDPIPQVQDAAQWGSLTTGAWCYYQNNSANGIVYGKLYNWYAVTDPRGLAPTGFRIPSRNDLLALNSFLGGESIAGGKLKSLTLWNAPNTNATNSTGFSALPSGVRAWDGTFTNIGNKCFFWTDNFASTVGQASASVGSVMSYDQNSNLIGLNNVRNGFSIRCIKN